MVKLDVLSLANYIIANQVGQRTVIYPYVEGEIKRLEQEGKWGINDLNADFIKVDEVAN